MIIWYMQVVICKLLYARTKVHHFFYITKFFISFSK